MARFLSDHMALLKAHKKLQKKGRRPSGKSKESKVRKLISFLKKIKKGKKTKGKH
jgi:hypothetical protein